MKAKFFSSVIISFLMLLIICNVSHAKIYNVVFEAFTTNYSDSGQKQMNFWIEVFDTVKKNPPEFVSSITVTAPDGTVLNMHPVKSWLPLDRGYWGRLYANDYIGAKSFAGGTYKCKVVGKAGATIVDTDDVARSFLPIPKITNPSDGAGGVSKTATLRWKAVAGAKQYRVLLWDNSWNEPVYWFWGKRLYLDQLSWKIPLGDLQSGHSYQLRIEARASEQDTDKRSRSDWVSFKIK